jgi:hypothetical protein
MARSLGAPLILLLVAAVLGSEAGASGKGVTTGVNTGEKAAAVLPQQASGKRPTTGVKAGEKAAVLPQHAAEISAQPPKALVKGPRGQGGVATTTRRAQSAHAAHRQGGNVRSAQHVVSWLAGEEGDAEVAATEGESWLLKTDAQGFTNLALVFIVTSFVIFGVTAICCLVLALRHDGADDSRCFPSLRGRTGMPAQLLPTMRTATTLPP